MPTKYTIAIPIRAPGIASSAVPTVVACRPGMWRPFTTQPNRAAPISAPRKAPTIPSQWRSGSQIVKCQRARPMHTQASRPISDASRDGGYGPWANAWTAPWAQRPRRRPSVRPRAVTAVTGGVADGPARLGMHGSRPLALHDLAARPPLGRDRGRLPRGADRSGPVRLGRKRPPHPGATRHHGRDRARGDPRRPDRDGDRVLRGHAPRTARGLTRRAVWSGSRPGPGHGPR